MRTAHPAVQAQLEELRGWLTSGEPLLMDPDWLSRMLGANAISKREVEGFFFLFDEKQPLTYKVTDGVAVLPIRGALAKKSAYRTTYGEIAEQVTKAANDRKVRGILLDMDSPGGVVSGVEEATAAVARASAEKPVYALANDYMASAAYWVASPATKILSTKYGTVGSIGVVLMHMDYSKQNERIGVKPTFITGGRKKTWGNPEEPLSEEARADLQKTVDHYYWMFAEAVAKNRKLDLGRVIGTEAGVYLPEDAKSAGLVDEVMSFDDCAGQLSAIGGSKMSESTQTDPKEPKAQVVDIDDVREKAKAEAKREAADRARKIKTLCALAGKPELAGDMIDSEKTTDQVGEALIELRAKEDERHKTLGAHGSGAPEPGRKLSDSMVSLLKARGMEPRKDTLHPL